MSQLVTLHVDSKPISVLCHMGDFGCGDGGWTPVMKIDGEKVWNFSGLRELIPLRDGLTDRLSLTDN